MYWGHRMNDKIVKLFPAKTFRELARDASENEDAVRGFIIWFDKEGTLHFGDKDTTFADTGMTLMYLTMLAAKAME